MKIRARNFKALYNLILQHSKGFTEANVTGTNRTADSLRVRASSELGGTEVVGIAIAQFEKGYSPSSVPLFVEDLI